MSVLVLSAFVVLLPMQLAGCGRVRQSKEETSSESTANQASETAQATDAGDESPAGGTPEADVAASTDTKEGRTQFYMAVTSSLYPTHVNVRPGKDYVLTAEEVDDRGAETVRTFRFRRATNAKPKCPRLAIVEKLAPWRVQVDVSPDLDTYYLSDEGTFSVTTDRSWGKVYLCEDASVGPSEKTRNPPPAISNIVEHGEDDGGDEDDDVADLPAGDRTEADQHYQSGVKLKAAKDHDGATRELSKAVELAPEHVQARYALGWVYVAKGQNDKAIVQFEEVVRLAPDGEQGKEAQAARDRLSQE